eukprot:scaffold9104_cov100-Isochrysis_galbana.AAC.1
MEGMRHPAPLRTRRRRVRVWPTGSHSLPLRWVLLPTRGLMCGSEYRYTVSSSLVPSPPLRHLKK